MTYATDIAGDNQEIYYYVTFEGIGPGIGQQKFANAPWSLGSPTTFYDNLLTVSIGEQKLDRSRGAVLSASVSMEIHDDENIRALFARRGTEVTLSSAVTDTGTSLATNEPLNFGWLFENLYLDRETVYCSAVGGTTAGTYTVTRGAQSSVQSWHRSGAILSDKPRHWIDRRYSLYAVTQNGNTQKISSGIITSSPTFSEGIWTLEGLDLMTLCSRDVHVGFEEISINKAADSYTARRNNTYEMDDAGAFVETSNDHSQVIVKWEEPKTQTSMVTVHKLLGVDTVSNPNDITISQNVLFYIEGEGTPGTDRIGHTAVVESIQQRTAITGTMKEIALRLLLSVFGDGANNATYDVLPGREPGTSSNPTVRAARTGLGIPAADVDISSFDEMDDGLESYTTLYLDEPASFADIWANEFSWRVGGYIHLDSSGAQIRFSRYDVDIPSTSATALTEDDYSGAELISSHDEGEILSRAVFETNYSQKSRRFLHSVSLGVVGPDAMYYDNRSASMFKSATVWIGARSPSTPWGVITVSEVDVVMLMDRVISRLGDGVPRYSFRLSWKHSQSVAIGTLVTITDSRTPNPEGSLGLAAVKCEVVSVALDLESREMEVVAEQIQTGYLVAPAVHVLSYDGGTKTITIDESGPEADLFDAGSPAYHFDRDWYVRIYDKSASPAYSTSEAVYVSTVQNDNEITLTSAPGGFTPAAGDLVCLEYDDTAPPSSNTASETSADPTKYIFQTVDNGYLGTYPSHTDGSKWS